MDHAVRCATHLLAPRSRRKFELCSGSSCFDESNEVRGGDAQGGAAHGGPGCEEGAGERGGGGWDSGEGSGSSNGVVVERGSRHDPGAQSGAVAKPSVQASLDQVWRGRDCFVCSSHLTCQRNHTQARPSHWVMLWCHEVVRVSQGLLLACRLPAARVIAAGARHASPASLHDLQGSRVQVDVNSPSARRAVAAKPRRYFENK